MKLLDAHFVVPVIHGLMEPLVRGAKKYQLSGLLIVISMT